MSGMSAEVEEQPSVVQPEDWSAESSKKPIRSYTREFLLSLSELEVCKKLPKEFDESLLSEFEEASNSTQDRRALGSSSLQGFKRADYGSSVPAKGDSGNYPRGLNRWDNRSSGRSDTDTDSESGRRYGNQARRSWQSSEHDGLLGSGSFPRPAGYAAGAPVPRFRPNENASLNRSNEPYHPPRPYKATPHSRREANDSFNDETFGSADDANEDRVEEEKKRRAEFEQMREQQHKALQEKQKSNKGKTEDPLSGIGLLANPSDDKISTDMDKVVKPTLQDDSSKLSVSSQTPLSRPLVPPGFVSSVADKSSTAKPIIHAKSLETGKLEPEVNHHDAKIKAPGRGSSELHSETSSKLDIKAENLPELSSVLQGADQTKAPRLPDVSEVLETGEVMGIDFEVTGPKLLGGPPRSTSILDKLFGTSITDSNGNASKFVEYDAKADELQNSDTLHSKFACWFPEEDGKLPGDVASEKPNNLLSLIVAGEKGGSNVPDVSATGSYFTPKAAIGNKTSNFPSSTAEMSEQFSNGYVTEAKPAVLTCEDLEQSILLEIGGDSSNSHPVVNEQHASEAKIGHVGNDIDNQASHHLLSLLQKGIGSKDAESTSVVQKTPDKPFDHEVGKVAKAVALNVNVLDADGLNSPGKTLTLESLFGTAFMKELHSAQRNTVGSARTDVSGAAPFPPAVNENGINHLSSNDKITKLDKVGEWLGFNGVLRDMELSKQPAEFEVSGTDKGMEVTLPEEDSLINPIDPVNAEKPMLVPNTGPFIPDLLPSSSSDILEKLAALGGARAPKDERSMVGGHDPRAYGRLDMVKPELPYQNLHPRASSPQLPISQMNHNRPLLHAMDPHPALQDSQLNFLPPEAVIHLDALPHHQFPANMGHPSFSHPSAGLPGFDHPIPSPMLQQMHMAGNLPPPHLARGFPIGAPMPLHPNHSPAGYIEEPNPLQNFPFGQQQPYFAGPGMNPTGPEHGVTSNPPEAFQRLLEMELRANPKQMHPFAAGNPSQAMYGHELDTGFRYR